MYSEDLEQLGVDTRPILLNDSTFDMWLKELKPTVVLFDRFLTEEQFGWRVATNCPDALRILDTQDLHSLRISRENCHKSGEVFEKDNWLTNPTTLRELASIFRSDITLVISVFELELLRETIPAADPLLWHLPFMENPVWDDQLTPYDSRSGFICIGNGRHYPNVDSMLWLHDKIWPGIRQVIPDASIAVCGAYLPEAVQALNNPDTGFYIRGWIPDARHTLKQARIQLAPLRFGAGLKSKLIDSMASGCPFVTTPVGAEGMLDFDGWEGCIAPTDKALISRALALYTDRKAWTGAQQRGASLINAKYNSQSLGSELLGRVEAVQGQLAAFRSKNLIGAMMMNNRMASTRYMGKWIEAKNRKNRLPD
jgi:hypothetical protein